MCTPHHQPPVHQQQDTAITELCLEEIATESGTENSEELMKWVFGGFELSETVSDISSGETSDEDIV